MTEVWACPDFVAPPPTAPEPRVVRLFSQALPIRSDETVEICNSGRAMIGNTHSLRTINTPEQVMGLLRNW